MVSSDSYAYANMFTMLIHSFLHYPWHLQNVNVLYQVVYLGVELEIER